jgi:benzylsuccinate CoA-transferase BbsF subunit
MWIAIAARTHRDVATLAQILDLAGEPTEDGVAAATAALNRDVLVSALLEQGVPAAAVKTGKDVFESDDLAVGGHFVTLDHPVLKSSKMPAPPYRFSETPWEMRRAPLLGEHNQSALGSIAGLSADDVSRLEAEGVLG